jgi:hypothetical protein
LGLKSNVQRAEEIFYEHKNNDKKLQRKAIRHITSHTRKDAYAEHYHCDGITSVIHLLPSKHDFILTNTIATITQRTAEAALIHK